MVKRDDSFRRGWALKGPAYNGELIKVKLLERTRLPQDILIANFSNRAPIETLDGALTVNAIQARTVAIYRLPHC